MIEQRVPPRAVVPPTKRMGRPRRGEERVIDPVGIVQAALEMTEKAAPKSWGMRDLARALNVSPKMIYGHFQTKEQILQAASRMLIGRMVLPDNAMAWDVRLRLIVEECRRLRAIYPTLSRIELILSLQDIANPHVRIVLDAILTCFRDAGVTERKARDLTRMFLAVSLGEMTFDDAGGTSGSADGLETALDFIVAGIKADIAKLGNG